MKKTILIGATAAVIIATTFVYVQHERNTSQTVSTSFSATASTTETAVLKVGEKTYSVTVRPGETVIDAMRVLESAGTFSFTGRDYPGMGVFIDSINGVKNANGKYWILYVNGIPATAGASAVAVSAGDIVEWKYEKGQ